MALGLGTAIKTLLGSGGFAKDAAMKGLDMLDKGIDSANLTPQERIELSQRSTELFTKYKEATKHLEKYLGEKAYSPQKLLTPTQASKLMGKAFVKEYAFKPAGSPSIASNDDKRHSIKLDASIDFME